MEDGDAESLALWRRFKDMSIKRFEPTYARMNIHFDTYNGESAVKPESMEKAVELLEKANLLETDPNGAILVNLEPYKLGKTIIRKAGEWREGTWSRRVSKDNGLTIHIQYSLFLSQTAPASTSLEISEVQQNDTKSTNSTR